jgi:ABC-type nitrate/sulfonate/bicarbonate transport system ATPase subunit
MLIATKPAGPAKGMKFMTVAQSTKDVITSTTDAVKPLASLSNVEFHYADGTPVIAGISMDFMSGSIVGIVGPSGCGKSTLLYLLAGLLEPTAGTVMRPTTSASGRHPTTMVFQKETILPWLTVRDNVLYFARLRKHRLGHALRKWWLPTAKPSAQAEELNARVDRLLQLVHLTGRDDAYPYELSGGMRRRLQFLTGVAPIPQLLLLDEPFSAVDEPTRITIHQDVLGVVRELGMTAILVTHDLAEAATLCDRVLILSNRPAFVAEECIIPLPKERDMLTVRGTDLYKEVYADLWNKLSLQIKVSNNESIEDTNQGRS